MQITILGSGTSIPLSYRASPSIMVRIKEKIIILDLGPGTLRQLARTGTDSGTIDHVLLSHFHPDHTADLIHLLFVTKNPTVLNNRKPFLISGAAGLKKLVKDLQNAYGHWLDLPENIVKIEELSTSASEKTCYDGYTVTHYHADHTGSSLAYRIEDETGKSIVYTGDTGYCDEIISAARGADTLILECAVSEGSDVEGHLTPSEAGRIAQLAAVKKLVLVHFYPEVLSTDIPAGCRKYYDGELILGRDMLRFEP